MYPKLLQRKESWERGTLAGGISRKIEVRVFNTEEATEDKRNTQPDRNLSSIKKVMVPAARGRFRDEYAV